MCKGKSHTPAHLTSHIPRTPHLTNTAPLYTRVQQNISPHEYHTTAGEYPTYPCKTCEVAWLHDP